MIEAIIARAIARRAEKGIEPLGAAAILRQPHSPSRPGPKKSPTPLVHAASKRVRTEIRIYTWHEHLMEDSGFSDGRIRDFPMCKAQRCLLTSTKSTIR